MFENAIYSVISPEGCASILWRDPSKSLEAAKAMKLTAKDLLRIGIIDEVISEPLGGAHRNKEHIITLYLALQRQNFVMGNSLKNLIDHWPHEEIVFIHSGEGIPI